MILKYFGSDSGIAKIIGSGIRQALHAIPYNTGQLDEACHISNVLYFRTCFINLLTEKQKPHTFTFLECMVKNFAEYKAGFSSKGDT